MLKRVPFKRITFGNSNNKQIKTYYRKLMLCLVWLWITSPLKDTCFHSKNHQILKERNFHKTKHFLCGHMETPLRKTKYQVHTTQHWKISISTVKRFQSPSKGNFKQPIISVLLVKLDQTKNKSRGHFMWWYETPLEKTKHQTMNFNFPYSSQLTIYHAKHKYTLACSKL